MQINTTLCRIPRDITAEILEKLVQSPNQLPAISELKNFLNEKPSVKIPLAPIHFSLFPIGNLDGITEQERDTYFVQNTEAECTSLFCKYLGPLISPPTYGKNEDSYHAFWDSIIKSTIEVFGKHSSELPTLEFDRNTSKHTSTGRNLPDMVALVRNVCPFRGEEKSREEAGDPLKELIEKFRDWTYGDAPYLLAYYAVGVLVTFVTLHKPKEEANKKRKRSVYSQRIEEFDLSRLSHRFRAMNFLRNICRLLLLIVNLCPPRDSPDFETIIRPN
ncbi:hypothetical protein RclHR1_13630005 [Rhizophagus clarus]|uniref:Uncharacterized protein n=1 Tax=Rhizophagus clarus TaxID=94130 RepID=A0A2Z6QCF7_9GLOM|nr:hypothetical protein RclHR1_13630005 [Rhizophagus clarus]